MTSDQRLSLFTGLRQGCVALCFLPGPVLTQCGPRSLPGHNWLPGTPPPPGTTSSDAMALPNSKPLISLPLRGDATLSLCIHRVPKAWLGHPPPLLPPSWPYPWLQASIFPLPCPQAPEVSNRSLPTTSPSPLQDILCLVDPALPSPQDPASTPLRLPPTPAGLPHHRNNYLCCVLAHTASIPDCLLKTHEVSAV